MAYETILYSVEEEVATLTLNRPEVQNGFNIQVCDEIMAAISAGFLEEKEVVHFLQNKPGTLEVVMTGRNPGEELLKLADYVTEMKMCKHPYEKGISARRMIEW